MDCSKMYPETFYMCDVRRQILNLEGNFEDLVFNADDYHLCDIYSKSFAMRKYASCPYLQPREYEFDETNEVNTSPHDEINKKCSCFTDIEKRPYVCTKCNQRFSFKGSLDRHCRRPAHDLDISEIEDKRLIQRHHLKTCPLAKSKERPYNCMKCDKKYTAQSSLLKHVTRQHFKNKRQVCDICLKGFKNQDLLDKHYITHTQPAIECDVCNRTFKDEARFVKHYAMHKTQIFTCRVCAKTFDTIGRYNRHQKRHIKPPSTCDICNKTYTNKYYFEKHYRAHTEPKQYQCDMCDAGFFAKSNLVGHYRIHTREKPFECDVCHIRFTLKSTLSSHYLTHTKEKRHMCPVCHKTFSRSTHAREHYITVHTNDKPYMCDLCNKSFPLRSILNAHYKFHTGREKKYLCPTCGKAFTTKCKVERHIVTHTKVKAFWCEICDRGFTQKTSLATHNKIFHIEKEQPDQSFADFSEITMY